MFQRCTTYIQNQLTMPIFISLQLQKTGCAWRAGGDLPRAWTGLGHNGHLGRVLLRRQLRLGGNWVRLGDWVLYLILGDFMWFYMNIMWFHMNTYFFKNDFIWHYMIQYRLYMIWNDAAMFYVVLSTWKLETIALTEPSINFHAAMGWRSHDPMILPLRSTAK